MVHASRKVYIKLVTIILLILHTYYNKVISQKTEPSNDMKYNY